MIKNYDYYSEFMEDMALKSLNIDLVIKKVKIELSLLYYNFIIIKDENKIIITLKDIKFTWGVGDLIRNLDTLMINRMGWFPSIVETKDYFSMNFNIFAYDRKTISDLLDSIDIISIIYEPKYDIEEKMPDRLYHLSIQQYNNSIKQKGIIPKSKCKMTHHLDRIYLCNTVQGCHNLIHRMTIHYSNLAIRNKYKFNTKWIIYEVDSKQLNIKLYKDPNYDGGFYTIDNIPPNLIKIYKME